MKHMHIDSIVIYLTLVLVGLVLGSFAGASVWRLRARQLVQDKSSGEHVYHDEYARLNKLTKSTLVNDRSQCLHCSYTLKWYDLIPLFSWMNLRGRCRKCRKPIGFMEPLIEVGVAAFFVLSYMYWPYPLNDALEVARLILWLIAGVGLAILFVYDTKWYLLPDKVNFAVIGIGALSALSVFINSHDKPGTIISILGSVFILSGIYLILYIYSKGKWIGFGDIKLGLGLGLLLADWELAFVALFAANLIGCILVLPAMVMGKLKRNSHVPFGPLLIIGSVIAGLAGVYLLSSYSFYLP